MADTDKYSEYNFEEYSGQTGRKGRSKTEAAKEKKSHATEGHKLAHKIKITKTMINSHHNEAGRKPVPVRKPSNESTDAEDSTPSPDIDIDNI